VESSRIEDDPFTAGPVLYFTKTYWFLDGSASCPFSLPLQPFQRPIGEEASGSCVTRTHPGFVLGSSGRSNAMLVDRVLSTSLPSVLSYVLWSLANRFVQLRQRVIG
jgi:hypothetical protein